MINVVGVVGGGIMGSGIAEVTARSGCELDSGLIDAMCEFGILYDREDGGEFYHLYMPVYGSRVFFEVVQRVGSYGVVRSEFGSPHVGAASRKREPAHVSNG
jgi:4-hydroxyphenylpyruvate dioxygenase-like putative hemolysin